MFRSKESSSKAKNQYNREELKPSSVALDQATSSSLHSLRIGYTPSGVGNISNGIENYSSASTGLAPGNTGTTAVSPSFQSERTRTATRNRPLSSTRAPRPPPPLAGYSTSKAAPPAASARTTPRRKLFEKIFGTPGRSVSKQKKEVVVSPTSFSQDRHLGFHRKSVSAPAVIGSSSKSENSSLYGVVIDTAPSSSSEAAASFHSGTTTTTISSSTRTAIAGSPSITPRLSRRLLDSHRYISDEDSNRERRDDDPYEKVHRMKSPEPSSPVGASGHPPRNTLGDALSAATMSPDQNDHHMLFLPQSSDSSDMMDEPNENEDRESSSRTPDRQGLDRHPMKTPGLAIPTPAGTKGSIRLDAAGVYHHSTSSSSSSNRDSKGNVPFFFPLRSITESPVVKHVRPFQADGDENPSPHRRRSPNHGDDKQLDDDAFLPDDFKQTTIVTDDTFTRDQVEEMIQKAKVSVRQELNECWEKKLMVAQEEADSNLVEYGRAWKEEADAESDRLKALLKEEKYKTSQKHHELLNNAQKIADVTSKLEQCEADRNSLLERVAALERNSGTSIVALNCNENGTEACKTQIDEASNEELNRQIIAMEKELDELREQQIVSSNREELVILKGEKASADRQISDLTERLRVRMETSNNALKRLEEAENEITNLRGQLAETSNLDSSVLTSMSDASLEDLFASKAEVENLKRLRSQDIQEKEELRTQLGHVEEMYRTEIDSPRSRGANLSSSAPTYDSEAARDLQKARDQLVAMGKVLKRYKSERDDVRVEMKDMEQRQIQAIEIAVKQATKDLKQKVQSLMQEAEGIRMESAQIATTEIGALRAEVEEMKERHQTEVDELKVEFERSMQQARTEGVNHEEALRSQFKEEKQELLKSREAEVAAFQGTIEELRMQHQDEIELAKLKSKEEAAIEVNYLEDKIRSIEVEFENEKIELIQTTSKDIEELEEQIKKMNEMHEEEVELVRSEARDEVDELHGQIQLLHSELNEKPSGYTEDFVSQLKAKFEDDMMDVKSKAKCEMERLRFELESAITEREEAFKKTTKLQSQLSELQERLATKSEQARSDFERQLKELRQDHAKESDELLEQLDLVEAEHVDRFQKLQVVVGEKETVISAMGSQLADSESRCVTTSKKLELLNKEVERLNSALAVATTEVGARRQEILELTEKHAIASENHVLLREKACEEAREEMIERAEKQFEERQEMYRTLKNRFDNSTSMISVLERDLRFAKKETEELKKRKEGREADLLDEIAQGKAGKRSLVWKKNPALPSFNFVLTIIFALLLFHPSTCSPRH